VRGDCGDCSGDGGIEVAAVVVVGFCSGPAFYSFFKHIFYLILKHNF